MTPLLTASHLTKKFGQRTVVNDVSFTLESGEVLGLLGPNGAGKTTTVGMLYGTVRPTSGTVTLCGYDPLQNGSRARELTGVVTQENNLDRDFSVEESLDVFATFYGMARADRVKRVGEVMELLQLTEYRDSTSDTLSGGFQRRLVLARALLNRPKVLFLDEPTTGLDPDVRQQLWKVIEELRAAGVGILLTTHYMEEAERLCGRILLLKDGTVIDEGTPRELIDRVIGVVMVEVGGIPTAELAPMITRLGCWGRPLGNHTAIGGPEAKVDECFHLLEQMRPPRLMRRNADLQDVFLYLTGQELSR